MVIGKGWVKKGSFRFFILAARYALISVFGRMSKMFHLKVNLDASLLAIALSLPGAQFLTAPRNDKYEIWA